MRIFCEREREFGLHGIRNVTILTLPRRPWTHPASLAMPMYLHLRHQMPLSCPVAAVVRSELG